MNIHAIKGALFASFCTLVFQETGLAAAEKEFPDLNFAVTPPDSWVDQAASITQKGVVVAYGDPARKRVVYVITSTEGAPETEANEQFAAECEKGVESSGGGRRLSSRFVRVQSIMCYERTGAVFIKGKNISTISRTIPIRGRFFAIMGMRIDDGPAGEDKDIRAFIESFRFLTPPLRVLDVSAAYHFGSFIAQATLTVLAIVGTVLLISHVRKPSRSRPSSSPPPVPPLPPKIPPPLPK